MRIASVETGLQETESLLDFLRAQHALAQPELTQRGRAREDDVRETFDFLPGRRERVIALKARGPIDAAPGNGDEAVLDRPRIAIEFLQVAQSCLELIRPDAHGGGLIDRLPVEGAPELRK